jgi:hypothetical protein
MDGVTENLTQAGKTVTYKGRRPYTPDELIEALDIDLTRWEVTQSKVNSWDMGFKTKEKTADTKTLWQVSVWLKPKFSFAPIVDELLQEMRDESPVILTRERKIPKESFLLELSPFDLHFGKLAWNKETDNDYDLKIAESFFLQAIQDTLDMISHFSLEHIAIIVGQDFLHVNNDKNETYRGTPQNVDSRLPKIFKTACWAFIQAIEYCREIAPVSVIYVPGNHDKETCYYLAEVLEARFHNDSDVVVDSTPKSRKYVVFGRNLIGFTHGQLERHRDLPLLMASEAPVLWEASDYREVHVGHFHKKKEMFHLTADTFGGTTVRVLPSLSGTDLWHFDRGFVGNRRAMESYLWRKDGGLAGIFPAYID